MDTVRDMLSVGQDDMGRWAVYRWDSWPLPRTVVACPDELEAWGITSLILENVESYGHDIDRAIWTALDEYAKAKAESLHVDAVFGPLDNGPDADELGRMAHAHIMATFNEAHHLASWVVG